MSNLDKFTEAAREQGLDTSYGPTLEEVERHRREFERHRFGHGVDIAREIASYPPPPLMEGQTLVFPVYNHLSGQVKEYLCYIACDVDRGSLPCRGLHWVLVHKRLFSLRPFAPLSSPHAPWTHATPSRRAPVPLF